MLQRPDYLILFPGTHSRKRKGTSESCSLTSTYTLQHVMPPFTHINHTRANNKFKVKHTHTHKVLMNHTTNICQHEDICKAEMHTISSQICIKRPKSDVDCEDRVMYSEPRMERGMSSLTTHPYYQNLYQLH